jgi:hypothetical protein
MEPVPKLDPMTEMALRSLHDISMPPPVSWLPQTWGWALLAALLLSALLFLGIAALRRYRNNAYRREALRELVRLENEIGDAESRGSAFPELAELLKRTALAAWPRAKIAALTGEGWLRFLVNSGGAAEGLSYLFNDLEYRNDTTFSSVSEGSARKSIGAARQWIEKHHVSA